MHNEEAIKDFIFSTINQDSQQAEFSLNTILAQKVADRLDDLRIQVANSMFNQE